MNQDPNNNVNNNVNTQYDPKNPNNNYNPFEDKDADKEFEMKWRTWNNLKPQEKQSNIFYGVDVNDKEAVKKAYYKYKFRHHFVTLLTAIILGVLGVIAFEFYRVNFLEQHPILAVKKRVDNGYLYTGIGFESLYCDDGTKYVVNTPYTSCNPSEVVRYDDIILNSFKEYGIKNNIINEGSLLNLSINSYEFDETVTETYTDIKTGNKVTDEYNYFLVDFNYTCSDTEGKCVWLGREYEDTKTAKAYVKMNKDNKVVAVEHFRTSGKYYDSLKEQLIPIVREYFNENDFIPDDEMVRLFSLSILESYGNFKYEGVYYPESYVISIEYFCKDNSNTCINYYEYDTTENLTFDIAILMNSEGKISKVGKRVIFDL